jgi:hypothetical protein
MQFGCLVNDAGVRSISGKLVMRKNSIQPEKN